MAACISCGNGHLMLWWVHCVDRLVLAIKLWLVICPPPLHRAWHLTPAHLPRDSRPLWEMPRLGCDFNVGEGRRGGSRKKYGDSRVNIRLKRGKMLASYINVCLQIATVYPAKEFTSTRWTLPPGSATGAQGKDVLGQVSGGDQMSAEGGNVLLLCTRAASLPDSNRLLWIIKQRGLMQARPVGTRHRNYNQPSLLARCYQLAWATPRRICNHHVQSPCCGKSAMLWSS